MIRVDGPRTVDGEGSDTQITDGRLVRLGATDIATDIATTPRIGVLSAWAHRGA